MAGNGGKESYEFFRDFMYLIEYMINNTNEEHKISQSELEMALLRRKDPTNFICSKVYRSGFIKSEKVKNFLANITQDDDKELFKYLKFMVSKQKFKGPECSAKKYYVEGPLSERTVQILRDAVAVYPYAEAGVTKEIIKELNAITNKFNRCDYSLFSAEKYPGTYYENLKEIHKALSTSLPDVKGAKLTKEESERSFLENERSKLKKKAVSRLQFEYYAYDYDPKSNKVTLIPRPLKNGSLVRTVNPLMLMWSNGYYYLVTYFKKDDKYVYINYRVDRMKNVKCLPDSDALQYDDREYIINNKFDAKYYVSCNPVMYSNAKRYDKVVIECSDKIMNNVLDTFGYNIKMLEMKNGMRKFAARKVTGEGVIMWALEYCNDCEIVEPEELRDEMRRRIDVLARKYGTSVDPIKK